MKTDHGVTPALWEWPVTGFKEDHNLLGMGKKTVFFITALLTAFCGCKDITTPAADPSNADQMSAISVRVTEQEALDKAMGYYPDGVRLQYVRQDRITDESDQDGFVDQECYLFDVTHNGKHVSSAAVGVEDASIWFLDMNDKSLWLSEGFMGLPADDGTQAPRDPVIEISRDHANGRVSLYFAHLDTVAELSCKNEGSASWDEKENSLMVSAVKVTGTVTGAPDGPSFVFITDWTNATPVLKSIDYQPAPIYSQPDKVLLSGETMSIPTQRLLEIAAYFKNLIDETAA